jgi:hypothetical protein
MRPNVRQVLASHICIRYQNYAIFDFIRIELSLSHTIKGVRVISEIIQDMSGWISLNAIIKHLTIDEAPDWPALSGMQGEVQAQHRQLWLRVRYRM